MDQTFSEVEAHLRKVLPPRKRAMPITPETELYSDLGMYGDVIAFDVVFWASRKFGVEGTFRLDDYAPGEMPGFLRPLARFLGWNRGYYKSLKVSDVVRAIETKRWPE
jgi:hypothetical protein